MIITDAGNKYRAVVDEPLTLGALREASYELPRNTQERKVVVLMPYKERAKKLVDELTKG